MHRAIVLIPGALLLASCAEHVWKVDESRYPTKAQQEAAFARYSDHCMMKSRVIVRLEEPANGPQAVRSGHRIVYDNARFNACMAAAGFRYVKEDGGRTPPTPALTPTPKQLTKEQDDDSARTDVAAAPLAAALADARATPPVEPEPAAPSTAPPAEKSTPAAPATTHVAAAGGAYRIQLASLASRPQAEREWARLRVKWPEILGSREPIIVRKSLAERGTFYRVQTGGFETLQAARSVCATLRAQRQACFAVRGS